MWMMGYNDGGGEYNTQDSFNTRKLRPLIPRPISSSTTNNIPSSTLPSLTRTLRATDFFALNHPMDQSKRELNTGAAVVVSSRWNPTPEQLRTLEELYRRGTRTPSADQIQHITAQLRMYGKIEGKNVFYWFQNHKARERQKRRRQVDVPLPHEPDIHERKESGSSRTSYEGGQTKKWSPSTNCSREEYAPSKQKASVAAESVLASAECSRRPENGWIQFDPDPTTSIIEGNVTCQMNPTTSNTPPTNTSPRAKRTTMVDVDPNNSNKKLLKAHELMNIFIASSCCLENGEADNVVTGYGSTSDSQTLQLFPVRSSINAHRRGEYQTEQNRQTAKPRRQLLVMDEDSSISSRIINNTIEANSNLTSSFQFYEFLPLKN